MKLKRILSLALASILICGICFISGVSAETSAIVREDGNFLLNGSFELAETKNNGNSYGYQNWHVNSGGIGTVVDYWNIHNYIDSTESNISISHTTDAHTGSYALRFDVPRDHTHSTYPSQLAVDKLPVGNYRLTAWVKGTNSASYIEVIDADGVSKKAYVVASDTWTKISIEGITSIKTTEEVSSNTTRLGIAIKPKVNSDRSVSYFIIDDIRLETVEAQPVEYLSGGEFEYKNNEQGYTLTTEKGQILLADGWNILTSGETEDARVEPQHIKDGYSGYAVNVVSESGDGYAAVCPLTASLNTAAITEGYYTLSAWVKCDKSDIGDNASIELQAKFNDADGKEVTKDSKITVGTEWHNVSLSDIYLTDGAKNLAEFRDGIYELMLYLPTNTSDSDAYITFDSISLISQQEPFYNGSMEIDGTGTSSTVPHGQANPNTILQGFVAQDYSSSANTYDIVTDAVHSGSQALKITWQKSSSSMYPIGKEIGAGTYKLSIYAKGNATNAGFKVSTIAKTDDTSTAVPKTFVLSELSENEFKCYEYIFTVNEGDIIQRALAKDESTYYNKGICFGIFDSSNATAGEYAIFDDVKLEKINSDINVAKESVLGIQSLKIGDTKLTLPSVGDYFNVSVIGSTDENIIDLAGGITAPVHRTQVDVTLRISRKDDTSVCVDLAPIGVVVPGTEQTAIDAVRYNISTLPNNQDDDLLLPIHYQDAVNIRKAYDALSDAGKKFVANYKTLDERDSVLNQYSAVIGDASVKDNNLRIKSAYPTLSADGYTLKEYGVLFIPLKLAQDENITLETANVAVCNLDIVPGDADAEFYSILNGSGEHKDVEILMRSFVTYTYGDSQTVTLYGRTTVEKSMSSLS